MLSQSKQNILDPEKPTHSQSTRRNSTHSTSACKKILKSICEDSQLHLQQKNIFESTHGGDSTIREIKLKETINILQKKNCKQMEEILVLTRDLNTLAKVRQEELRNLEVEMEKIRKCQLEKNLSTKTINQLKKKVGELEKENTGLKTKSTDMEKKFIKLKEILRKKQINLAEITSKLQQSDGLQTITHRQKEQLQSLRQNYIKQKQKQSILEQENELYRAKISQNKKQEGQIKSRLYILEEENRRLQEQLQQLENHCEQSKKESADIEQQMRMTIDCQNREIKRLRELVAKIQGIEADNKESKFGEVFKQEIVELLKTNVVDRGARSRLQKSLFQIIDNMEESTSRIMMQILATHL